MDEAQGVEKIETSIKVLNIMYEYDSHVPQDVEIATCCAACGAEIGEATPLPIVVCTTSHSFAP